MVPYIITNNGVTVFLDNEQKTVDRTHPHYEDILEAIRDEDVDDLRDLIDLSTAIKRWSNGVVTVEDGEVKYRGAPIKGVIVDRILSRMADGFSPESLARFLENVKNNPSNIAVEELYLFLEHNEIPITNDGHFLAYKRVREDYKDVFSGRFDNSVGAVVSMPRNEVDDRRENTCSKGLHFCAAHYLPSYASGRRVMVVKINPADVVSIPSDYNNAKGRTWKYSVIAEDTSRSGESLDKYAYGNHRDYGDESYLDDDYYDYYDGDDDYYDDPF